MISDWLERLASREHLVRVGAAQALREGARRSEGRALALRVAREGLEQGDINARAEAARLAGALGMVEVALRLAALVEDRGQPVRVRRASAQALGLVGAADHVGALEALASHDHPLTRRVAVEAAGRLEVARAAPMLVAALGDRAWEVRLDAAIGLGGIPAPEAGRACLALLARLEREGDDRVAERALRSLAELGGREGAPRQEIIACFCERLGTSEAWRWRRASARGLGELGVIDALEALRRRLEVEEVGQVVEQLAWAVRALEAQRGGAGLR